MDRKALTEILAKDKTSAGMAAPNRFALPPVCQRSARNDHQRRRRLDKVAPPESRGGQGQYHREKRPGLDGEGLSQHGKTEDLMAIDVKFLEWIEKNFPGRDIPAHSDERLHNHGSSTIQHGRGAVLTVDLT